MKKILLIVLICFITPCAFAQKIELNIPAINFVTYKVMNERTNLDFASGALFSPLEAGFEVFSNDPENTMVKFEVYANTLSGDKNAIKIKNNKSKGTCALANNYEIPSYSSLEKALNKNTSPKKNPNTIAYDIEFKDLYSSNHPVYKNSQNAVIAKLDEDEYLKNYKILISNNSSQLSKTFDRAFDEAGDYSLTIYCTITSN